MRRGACPAHGPESGLVGLFIDSARFCRSGTDQAVGRNDGTLRHTSRHLRLSCRSAHCGETDWIRISALYEALAQVSPSPIVELNRAVALSMAFGPEIGLEIVDVLRGEPALKGYHLLPSVRETCSSSWGAWMKPARSSSWPHR